MGKQTTFRNEDRSPTPKQGKFKADDFIVYDGDPDKFPILQVQEEIDGYYVLEGQQGRFIRPVSTVDSTFQELWVEL